MSFPNSGTSFTSKMIRHLSQMSTASNYGEEVLDKDGKSIPMFDSNGPFWIEPPYSSRVYKTYSLCIDQDSLWWTL